MAILVKVLDVVERVYESNVFQMNMHGVGRLDISMGTVYGVPETHF
jgi:hypothetical protein